MRLGWKDLGTARADRAHGKTVELAGFALTLLPADKADCFLLMAEPGCCAACVPGNRAAVVEVFAKEPITLGGKLRLGGTWHVSDDADGWRYQLRSAAVKQGLSRRTLLAASPLVCLPVPAFAQTDGTAVDIHSHAGNLGRMAFGRGSPASVAEPMRKGGMAVICLSVVSDAPIIQLYGNRLRPSREPQVGELYGHTRRGFQAVHEIASDQRMPVVRTAAELRAATAANPSIIVAAEGADFLEGKIERLDEAYDRWGLRHLQLTHYRVNELGDIQTEESVHGGLTAFGAEVVRRCNQRGIVVDVAHGTFDLVKAAARATTKPLVLSHSSLTERPQPWTRLITPDHARAVAATGGVIGIWPIKFFFPDYPAYARGFARMAKVVGVDHVGLGTDLLGLVGSSTIVNYDELPQLAGALREEFSAEETTKILGGNYRRVFEASLA
ncbi:MAG TPA: membrane dipeptidase [Reyranellaceae bacterium]|nr:membrane dipeptidase [Reyranellaceae bacterium]